MGRGWVYLGFVLSALACGGRSERNESGDDGAAPVVKNGDDDDPGGGGDDDDDSPIDGVPLPGCDPGALDHGQMGAECLWLADGRCYSDKLEACACICPLDHESICSSGFPYDTGRTAVYCR